MTRAEVLAKECFRYLNQFKRARAMHETEKQKNINQDRVDSLELQMFKTVDQLELSLRGLQNEVRASTVNTTSTEE